MIKELLVHVKYGWLRNIKCLHVLKFNQAHCNIDVIIKNICWRLFCFGQQARITFMVLNIFKDPNNYPDGPGTTNSKPK